MQGVKGLQTLDGAGSPNRLPDRGNPDGSASGAGSLEELPTGRTSTEGTPAPEVLSTEYFMFHRGTTLTIHTIMKRLTNLLPALALVLGAFAAVAFTSPKVTTGEYGQAGGIWYDVEGINPDEDTYVCNSSPSQDCLFEEPSTSSTPISTEMDKVFVVQNAANLRLAE